MKEKIKKLKEKVNNKLNKWLLKNSDLAAKIIFYAIEFSILFNIYAGIKLTSKHEENDRKIRYEEVIYTSLLPSDECIPDNLINLDFRNTTHLLAAQNLEALDIEKNERERFINTTYEEGGITYQGNIDIYSYYFLNHLDDYSLLLLMNIPNSDINAYYDAVEKAYLTGSLDDMYNYFNAKSVDEQKDIDRVLSLYEKLQENNLSLEEGRSINSTMRIEIFRISLKNLINYTNANRNFKIYSNIFLYNFIKSVLFNDISLDEENIAQIQNMEAGYINYLSRRYNHTEEVMERSLKTDFTIQRLEELQSLLTYGKYTQNDYYNKQHNIESVKEIVEQFPLLKTIGYIHSYNIRYVDLDNLKQKTLSR